MNSFKYDVVGRLPIFDHIPDWIYEQTKCPESDKEALEYLSFLRAKYNDLKIQLDNFTKAENSHWMNGDLQAQKQWRYKATQSLRIVQQQMFLVKAWRRENEIKEMGERADKRREEKVKQYKEIEESKKAYLSKVEELGFNSGEIKRLKREIKFIRHSTGVLSESFLKLFQAYLPEDLRKELDRLKDALLELDRQSSIIDSKIPDYAKLDTQA